MGNRTYSNIICFIVFTTLLACIFIYRNGIKTALYPIHSKIIGKRLEKSIVSYVLIANTDYNMYYPDRSLVRDKSGFKKLGDRVLDFFGLEEFGSVDIIMHNDRVLFHSLMGIALDRPTTGAYVGGKINILIDDDISNCESNIFVHEFTHHITAIIAKGNYPTWFAEGVALYMEYYILDYEWGLGLEDISHIDMYDLNRRFHDLDEHMAYKKSFEIVRSLIEEGGAETFNAFIRELGRGKSFSRALDTYYKEILYKY